MQRKPPPVSRLARVMALALSIVVSGCGALAFFSRYAPPRPTRFGVTQALEGTAAQTFGLSIFFFGLLPLMLFARSSKQAAWMGTGFALLGFATLVIGLGQIH